MNQKKLHRLYREEGLSVKRRKGRKRALGERAPMEASVQPNERWSLDFGTDVFEPRRRFRILAVQDDCTRGSLALAADTSLSGARVARELDRLVRLYGKPKSIVSDNGSELTSRAILRWQNESGVNWHYIAPGKPTQNAFAERLASPAFGSMPDSGMNSSMRKCSQASTMPAGSSNDGDTTTIMWGRIHPSVVGLPPARAVRLSRWMAPFTARFPATRQGHIQLQDSPNGLGAIGGRPCARNPP